MPLSVEEKSVWRVLMARDRVSISRWRPITVQYLSSLSLCSLRRSRSCCHLVMICSSLSPMRACAW